MVDKIHIQHVLLSLQPGGLENGVVNVVNQLAADRFRSSVCCLKQSGEFAARMHPDVPVYEMNWQSGNDLLLPFRLARLFRRTRPDIVHTRNAESFYYGFLAAKLAGIRCIVHSEHGRTFQDRPLRFRIQRWFSTYTQGLFAVSHQLKSDLVRFIGIPEQRITVLYNGVDLERFKAGMRTSADDVLAFEEKKLIIGSVGRLVPVKDFALLLQAVALLSRQDLIVVLVGDGPERAALEALSASLGIERQVRFTGHSDDVRSLLTRFDIFVLPSLSEGMSNTLLEAMASGVACVASNVGGNPELVTHGESGFLFPCGDVASLTSYLKQLCDDAALRSRFGNAGRTRAHKDFSGGAMIARYEKFYLDAVTRTGVTA